MSVPWPDSSWEGARFLTRFRGRAAPSDADARAGACSGGPRERRRPGLVETPWTGGWDANEAIVARMPLRRAGPPEDIADGVAFLARTPFATGQVIAVDGGVTVT
jgi:hypothetical protein